MFNYKSTFIKPESTIIEALIIEESGVKLFSCDENEKLWTLTDGDLRRSLLNINSLNKTAGELITKNLSHWRKLHKRYYWNNETKHIRQIPIVDSKGKVVDLILLDLKENHID